MGSLYLLIYNSHTSIIIINTTFCNRSIKFFDYELEISLLSLYAPHGCRPRFTKYNKHSNSKLNFYFSLFVGHQFCMVTQPGWVSQPGVLFIS